MTHKNLLPSDTRTTEIISGVSLVLISILILTSGGKFVPDHMSLEHYWQFWGMISGIIGALQILFVLVANMEHARSVVAWITGSHWIWSGTHQFSMSTGQFYDTVLLVLGISCMYAFVINLLITSQKDQENGNDVIN